MIEFKGTKGKWYIFSIGEHDNENDNTGRHQVATTGKSGKTNSIDVWFGDNQEVKNKDEALANALLISKAPEMLEMLKSCLSFFEQLKEHGISKWSDEAKLRQLIKEATEL